MGRRILIVAYACEPGRGSEAEVGWRWSLAAAAAGYEVTVVTRANNREKIEAALAEMPCPMPAFTYHEAPAAFVALKRAFVLPRLYYLAWQFSLLPQLRQWVRAGSFDLYHHLTYVSARFPSVLALSGARFVWGPIGGLGRVPRALRRALGVRENVVELVRDATAGIDRVSPLWLATAARAERVLVADGDTMARLPNRVRSRARACPAIGIDVTANSTRRAGNGGKSVVTVGELVRRKGQGLVLKALSEVQDLPWEYEVVGEGPDRRRLERLAERLGIRHRVRFAGRLPRSEVCRRVADTDVFVLLSLRESGGMALLEAASAGVPIVFLKTGGPGDVFAHLVTGAVSPSRPDEVVSRAAEWMRALLGDEEKAVEAGLEARAAAEKMRWELKAEALEWLYGEAS